MLTVVYQTSREDPHFEWFAHSFLREIESTNGLPEIELIIVDGKFGDRPIQMPEGCLERFHLHEIRLNHVAPKPTVWQGPCRLTKEDWWAVSNTRNTALCHARGTFVAFVDDLSFLSPGWLGRVLEAMDGRAVVCGSYMKVKKINIDKDRLVSFEYYPQGHDNRWGYGRDDAVTPCKDGGWMYGCSLVAPLAAFLSINGYDERCDGLSFEDCITGLHIERKGWKLVYDRRLMTIESEEHHHQYGNPKRSDYGVSPNDKSHKILELAMKGSGWSPNDFGPFPTLAAMRHHVLAGGDFPVVGRPVREWFTGTLLREL